jgi:hypothetical protein
MSTEAAHGKGRRSNREREPKLQRASAYALSTAPPVAAPAATVARGRVPFPLSRPGAGAAARCPSPLGLSLPRPASSLSATRLEAPIHARWSQPLAEVKDHVRDWVAEDQEFTAEDRLKTFAAFPAGSEAATGLADSIEGDSAFLVDPGLDAAASASTTTANVAATAAVAVSGAAAADFDVRSTPSVEHPNAVSDRR